MQMACNNLCDREKNEKEQNAKKMDFFFLGLWVQNLLCHTLLGLAMRETTIKNC